MVDSGHTSLSAAQKPRAPSPTASTGAFIPGASDPAADLKTTNPTESTFAHGQAPNQVTKGPGSRAAGLAMAFKLLEAAQDRWRVVNAPHLVAQVRFGATFRRGC